MVEWLALHERRWVLKQSLGKLRVVDDWWSDRTRTFREAEAIQQLGPLLGRSALPTLIHTDRENYAFVMTAAPPGSVSWKGTLVRGQVDLAVARQAGALLAKIVATSESQVQLRKRFEDRTVFEGLRTNPFLPNRCKPQPGRAFGDQCNHHPVVGDEEGARTWRLQSQEHACK